MQSQKSLNWKGRLIVQDKDMLLSSFIFPPQMGKRRVSGLTMLLSAAALAVGCGNGNSPTALEEPAPIAETEPMILTYTEHASVLPTGYVIFHGVVYNNSDFGGRLTGHYTYRTLKEIPGANPDSTESRVPVNLSRFFYSEVGPYLGVQAIGPYGDLGWFIEPFIPDGIILEDRTLEFENDSHRVITIRDQN